MLTFWRLFVTVAIISTRSAVIAADLPAPVVPPISADIVRSTAFAPLAIPAPAHVSVDLNCAMSGAMAGRGSRPEVGTLYGWLISPVGIGKPGIPFVVFTGAADQSPQNAYTNLGNIASAIRAEQQRNTTASENLNHLIAGLPPPTAWFASGAFISSTRYQFASDTRADLIYEDGTTTSAGFVGPTSVDTVPPISAIQAFQGAAYIAPSCVAPSRPSGPELAIRPIAAIVISSNQGATYNSNGANAGNVYIGTYVAARMGIGALQDALVQSPQSIPLIRDRVTRVLFSLQTLKVMTSTVPLDGLDDEIAAVGNVKQAIDTNDRFMAAVAMLQRADADQDIQLKLRDATTAQSQLNGLGNHGNAPEEAVAAGQIADSARAAVALAEQRAAEQAQRAKATQQAEAAARSELMASIGKDVRKDAALCSRYTSSQDNSQAMITGLACIASAEHIRTMGESRYFTAMKVTLGKAQRDVLLTNMFLTASVFVSRLPSTAARIRSAQYRQLGRDCFLRLRTDPNHENLDVDTLLYFRTILDATHN